MIVIWCFLVFAMSLRDISASEPKDVFTATCLYASGEKFIVYRKEVLNVTEEVDYSRYNYTLELCDHYTCMWNFVTKESYFCYVKENKIWCPMKNLHDHYLMRMRRSNNVKSLTTSPKLISVCVCDMPTLRPITKISNSNRVLSYRYNFSKYFINFAMLRSRVLYKRLDQPESSFITSNQCLNGAPLSRLRDQWECQLELNPCKYYTVCVETKVGRCKPDLKCVNITSMGSTTDLAKSIKPNGTECILSTNQFKAFWGGRNDLGITYEYLVYEKGDTLLLNGTTTRNRISNVLQGMPPSYVKIRACLDCYCSDYQECNCTTSAAVANKQSPLVFSTNLWTVLLLIATIISIGAFSVTIYKTEKSQSSEKSQYIPRVDDEASNACF